MVLLPLLVSLAGRENLKLHTQGNQLFYAGAPLVLKGVNVPSLEWSNKGEFAFRSTRVAMEDWKANCIRLPLCQDRWFGKVSGQEGNGDFYRDTIDDIVKYVTRSNGFIILDLHWSDMGEWGKNLGQHKMPDLNSEPFWKEVAKKYRGNDRVLFDLYNEPHDVDWETWLNGGTVTEEKTTYTAVGMKQLLRDVRSMSARNVVVVGGLDWSYDLTGVTKLDDMDGNGIMFDAHIYAWKKDWDKYVGATATQEPVLIGAAGCLPDTVYEPPETWAPKLLKWISDRNLSFTAWSMHPTATPNLISDWNYSPTRFWGDYVKAALKGN